MVSSIVFLTEIPHHACALNIPICPMTTTMVSPGSFPETLHCFRQFPGTPGEANESAPERCSSSCVVNLVLPVSRSRSSPVRVPGVVVGFLQNDTTRYRL